MPDTIAISPHPDATAIGNDLLAAGRSANEAAVAMAAYLSVAMPHFCGLGGDAVWMTADVDGSVRALAGIGHAFGFTDGIDAITQRGPASILTSCGAVALWEAALAMVDQADIDLPRLLQPAITAAREGIAVGASQEFWRSLRAEQMPAWHDFQDFTEARQGSLLRQPALAKTLEQLARDGLRSFYDGAVADCIRADLSDLGVNVTQQELSQTWCAVTESLCLPYRDVLLHAPPPPTQGVTTLQIMGILERLGHASRPAEEYHLMVEAVKCAFLDRRDVEDRADALELAAGLLSPERLEAHADSIDRDKARPWPYRFDEADTVYFATRDASGNCVSALQSTYFDWGSGCRLRRSGLIWHNRGAGFSLTPGPNRLRAGKRPFHTLNPGIATRDGRPWLLYGTQGADGQPQTLTVLLRHAIDRDLDPVQALQAPRFLLGRTFSDNRDSLKLEPTGFEGELAALGHDISPLPALSQMAGQAGMVRIEDGKVIGAHDRRGQIADPD